MEYTIQANTDKTISIAIDEAREEIPILVDEFRKCSTDNCGYHSDEVRKIDFIEILEHYNGIEVHFTPKAGMEFDLDKMEEFVIEILGYAYTLEDGEIQVQIGGQVSNGEPEEV